MAREYARVKVTIWADSDFRRLTDPAQALYFRLLSSPTMSLCGVADWRPNRIAALTAGMTVDHVYNAATELIDRGYIVCDPDTEEVLIRSFVRHDGLIKTPNIAAAMCKDYAGTASSLLRGVIVHELQRLHDEEPEMKGWATASKLLSEESIDPSGMPPSKPSGMPSGNPSVMPSPIPSGNESHIPQPASLNQQPSTPEPTRLAAVDLDTDPDFVAFWAAYPRRDDKGHARKAWLKMLKGGTDPQSVIDAAAQYATTAKPGFIALPATWLNGERWLDESPFAGPEGSPDFPHNGTEAEKDAWVRAQPLPTDGAYYGGSRR